MIAVEVGNVYLAETNALCLFHAVWGVNNFYSLSVSLIPFGHLFTQVCGSSAARAQPCSEIRTVLSEIPLRADTDPCEQQRSSRLLCSPSSGLALRSPPALQRRYRGVY